MISTVPRAVEHGGTVVGAVVLLVFGLTQGREIQRITVDFLVVTVQVIFLEALSAMAVFTCFVAITGLLLAREVWSSRDAIESVIDGPRLTAIVPVYRDHVVMAESVESLCESAYENLEIVVVAEPNDGPTLDRARELAAERDRVTCLVNGEPGSKAGAINYAVRERDAEYIAVFDADERITPEFLPRAMGALLDGTDVFQGRRIPRPTGPVETVAYCERVVFHASYKLVELFDFTNCRSSSTVLTREAFERVGGYDDMLTEDLDFAHACYREGLTVRQARQCTNTMEAPHTLADLWGQRKRWRVGQIEVLHATVGDLLRGEIDRRGLVSIGRMCSSLFGSLFTLALTSKLLLLLVLDVESAFLLPFTALVATIGLVAWRDTRDGRIDGLSWTVVLAPLLYPAFGILTLKSLLEYGLSWDGAWYRVEKTGS
ncbi:glycosyltransferase [Natrinema salifodinae]|uniref:Glycosyltransferase, catalytic subunit of cellulose synthase and poly-beta-1,6-N-acetylglucosamine synthase n=1 Tax=Natrinema salifodinae TaxID=1202768 RepID=A0A1I0Q4J1_9EURY|nr:glycosyltransferase family 2 protein [Natrinema salifodinae]SEW21707.1 Glycosyltransferase, catalytic subunit of cellulose synthase and poly-beta-1,6-N-acetylglucosamine synthase [Natrinema salifodinae]